MKVEIRNVQYAAFASEETSCFEAMIYIDGIKAGRVSNEGHGSPHRFDDHTTEDRLNEYGKTLPAIVTEYDDPKDRTKKMVLEMDAEMQINELLEAWLVERDLKRSLAQKIVFVKPDGHIYETKRLGKDGPSRLLADEKWRRDFATRNPGAVILNAMPLPDAIVAYRKAATA